VAARTRRWSFPVPSPSVIARSVASRARPKVVIPVIGGDAPPVARDLGAEAVLLGVIGVAGYARVSTDENLELQPDAAGCTRVLRDVGPGTLKDRPHLDASTDALV